MEKTNSKIRKPRKIERTIKVVSRLGPYKFDKKKFPDAGRIPPAPNGAEYLITLEKGKIVELKSFTEYHRAKIRFRELLGQFSLRGEVTNQSSDEFTVLTEK